MIFNVLTLPKVDISIDMFAAASNAEMQLAAYNIKALGLGERFIS